MQESGTYELTLILGAATLLLWGVRMARTGVMRIYGSDIQRILQRALKNRVVTLLAGVGAATVLQSSIAVAVFASSLAAIGAIPVADGLLLLLGADVGSAFVAALLTLNLKALWPVLMFVGYIMHSTYSETSSPVKQFGRILLGIAMILIAMTFMSQVSSALASSELIRIVISSLGSELVLALLLFAILTWVAHSSIAILLFWASLVMAGITDDPALIMAVILGINLGNAVPPIIVTWNQTAPARRIVIGHGAIKLAGVFIGFLCLRLIGGVYEALPGSPGFRVVLLHIGFNCSLIVLFSGLVRPIQRVLEGMLVDPPKPADDTSPKYIPRPSDDAQGHDPFPVTALSRETLRILGTIQTMLETIRDRLIFGKPIQSQDVMKMEDKVNALYKAVRSYAVELTRRGLSDAEQKKVTALLRYTASLENAGDVICKTMLGVPEAMEKAGKQFSEQGREELKGLFGYLIGSSQLAAEVIMAWNGETAGVLVARKRAFKAMCHDSSSQHIDRLSKGVSNAAESSSAHLDLILELRWINTQLSSIGYDVLPESEYSRDETAEELIAHMR